MTKPNATTARASLNRLSRAEGLYNPDREHDACGIGFVVNMNDVRSHEIIRKGLNILCNLEHRGAVGADPKAGDGCGILIQMPDAFCRAVAARARCRAAP